MKLEPARELAEQVMAKLLPFTDRMEIAGSIRRGRPEVNDIDLVILPKVNALADIGKVCRENCGEFATPVIEGRQNSIYDMTLPGSTIFQLDLFFARRPLRDLLGPLPGNYGSILLCRTGSKEHNIYFVEQAKRKGLKWRPYEGITDPAHADKVLASEEEVDLFLALDLDFVLPERRER